MGNTDLKKLIYQQILNGAQPTAQALGLNKLLAIDEGTLGDFPWFWQNGTSFNAKTFNWLNNLFSYNADGYIQSNHKAFTSEYYNVLLATAYVLSATDSTAFNTANMQLATQVNTVVTDWTTSQGPIPATYTTGGQQINYIMSQVVTWGNPDLTLDKLRTSLNPTLLLPNMPLGADQLVNDLMAYLAKSSSIAGIQGAVISANNQLKQTQKNIQPAPATATPGWMVTVDDNGNAVIEPEIDIAETTGNIQNALLPTSGGASFSVTLSASQGASNEVNISTSSGAGVSCDIPFLFGFGSSSSTSLNIFSADANQKSVDISMTFNGVTTVTPAAASYNVSTVTGWWNPGPVQNAANPLAGQSGYQFNPAQPYNFGTNGTFGFLSRILISQQPVLKLTYKTSNYAAYQKTFAQNSSWGVSFLGIPLGGGSQSYYSCQTAYDANSQTVTVTMSPPASATGITSTDQLAYVVGVEMDWMGAA
jgi:hypothetical protein